MILSGGKGASCVPGDKENSKWIIWGSTLCTLHDSSLHAATVTECDKIHRGTCRSLILGIHLLDRAIKNFQKFHVKIKF